jgi:hypothetical protein
LRAICAEQAIRALTGGESSVRRFKSLASRNNATFRRATLLVDAPKAGAALVANAEAAPVPPEEPAVLTEVADAADVRSTVDEAPLAAAMVGGGCFPILAGQLLETGQMAPIARPRMRSCPETAAPKQRVGFGDRASSCMRQKTVELFTEMKDMIASI